MLFAAAFTAVPVHAQDEVVLTVGEESVSLADFEHFLKNNRDSVITEAVRRTHGVVHQLQTKVQAAEALGMDTVETFQKELAGYRTQLARPYLTNNELLDELVRQAWELQARGSARLPHPRLVQCTG